MNKRLRKKKHVGEFQELGFEVTIHLLPIHPNLDNFFWDFVEEAIEGNNLHASGGGRNPLEFFATWGGKKRGSATEEQRAAVGKWLSSRSEVSKFEVGPLRDVWYGW